MSKTKHLKRIMRVITSWINTRYAVFAALIVIAFINEFTLVIFDDNPPLGDSTVVKIRIFDLLLLIFALLFKQIVSYFVPLIKSMSHFTINYMLPVCITVVALDLTLGLIGFGYPSHYEQENIQRFPSPSDSFKGKPNAADHNEFGFRGDFRTLTNSYNVAIFGGSTTYNGNPPIVELMADELINQGMEIEVYNFGSVGSNHSQHVHRLIEFSDRFNFDLVIFYGGGNETLQYASYDPRPGYPYNFFFRNELVPWKQAMLRASSILGTIDMFSRGLISGLRDLKNTHIDAEWQKEIVMNYWRDLRLASSISRSIVQPNTCNKTQFLSVMQPGNPSTVLERDIWHELLSSQREIVTSANWHHLDLTHLASGLQFTDIIHVSQQSRKLIASEMANVVSEIHSSDCR